MRSWNNNLQRHREEQLQLRGRLGIVYDVIRDLGLHFKLIEIPGCSMITIGRSHHQFSHLDKDLVWTAQAERMGSFDYDNQNNANHRDSSALDDEDKVNLQKQETEINHLKLQLSNLSSQLQASKDKAINQNNANNRDSNALDDEDKRNLQKQEMEINQLKLQLSDLSSQYQASNNREKALLALNRTLQEKEGEVERLGNLKLKKSSRNLQRAE